jgi:hypothetical protein
MRKRGLGFSLVAVHSLMVGVLIAGTLMLPQILVHSDRWPPAHVIASAVAVGLAVAIAVLVTVLRFGISRLRIATLIPVALILVFVLSPQNGKLLNQKYSARSLAHKLERAPNAPHKVAVFGARRDIQYGLSFYLNEHVTSYQHSGVPAEAHLLVVRNYKQVPREQEAEAELKKFLAGRQHELLFPYPPRDLTVYWVDAKSPPQSNSAKPPPHKRSRHHRRTSWSTPSGLFATKRFPFGL